MYEKQFKKMRVPDVKVAWITPDKAKAMLEKSNFQNRRLKQATVRKYVADMRNGDWDCFAFEPLSFDENEDLINGQHRLNAVIRAGIAVPFYIATGVNKNAKIYDRGALRSTRDVLDLDGIHVSTYELGIVRWIFRFCFGKQYETDSQIKKYLLAHRDDIEKSYLACSKGKHNNSMITRRAPIMGSAYQAIRCGVEGNCVGDFMRIVNTGIPNEAWETAPLLARNYLLDHRSKDQQINAQEMDAVFQNAIFDYVRKAQRRKAYNANAKMPYRSLFVMYDKEEIDKIFGSTPQ